jgi:hypothetical protein
VNLSFSGTVVLENIFKKEHMLKKKQTNKNKQTNKQTKKNLSHIVGPPDPHGPSS